MTYYNQYKDQKQAEELQLSPKNHAKLSYTYMMFGSLMNGLSQSMINPHSDGQKKIVKWAWKFAKEETEKFAEEIYLKEDHERSQNIPQNIEP